MTLYKRYTDWNFVILAEILIYCSLKFDTNIYVSYEISCRAFGVRCLARIQGSTKVSQYITVYGGKIFKISFGMVSVHKI